MDFLVQAFIPYILLYKYWALFVITFLAASSFPIPAGTLLVASAAFASQGYFNITILLFVVIIANIIGDNLLYWLSRLYGRKFLSRFSFINKFLLSRNYNLIEKNINKRPKLVIFISRFEVISTLSINLICGLGKVEYKKFLLFEILGTFANVLFYTIIGYSFGNSWQAVNKLIGDFTIVFFLLIALILSLFWKKVITKLNENI